MKDKDQIKELFEERFSDFEQKVDPQVWNNIQSSLQGTAGLTSGVASSSGYSALWIAAVSVAAISVTGYFMLGSTESDIQEQISTSLQTEQIVTDPANNDIVIEKDVDLKVQKEELNLASTLQPGETSSASVTKEITEPVKIDNKIENIVNETPVKDDLAINEKQSKVPEEIASRAPESIVISEQSKVLASPMGGNAPLEVSFSSLADLKKVKWQFDDGNESDELAPSHTYNVPGIYFVTMLAELTDGSVIMEKAVVEVKEAIDETQEIYAKKSKIFIPNIFTPNDDGQHDYLKIVAEEVSSFTISIYSVNGKLVYRSENSQEEWNGTDLLGNRVEDGVYYYLVNAIGLDKMVYAPKGYITIRTGR